MVRCLGTVAAAGRDRHHRNPPGKQAETRKAIARSGATGAFPGTLRVRGDTVLCSPEIPRAPPLSLPDLSRGKSGHGIMSHDLVQLPVLAVIADLSGPVLRRGLPEA